MARLTRETRPLEQKPQGNGGWRKPGACGNLPQQPTAEQIYVTQEALTYTLVADHCIRRQPRMQGLLTRYSPDLNPTESSRALIF